MAMSARSARLVQTTAVHVGAILVAIVLIFPFYWMVLIAFRELPGLPDARLIPSFSQLTLHHFQRAWTGYMFPVLFSNSLIVSVCTTFLAILFSVLGAYALSRFRFWGRRPFALGILITQMLPGVLLCIPLYILLVGYGLDNTYLGVTIVYLTICLPFCTWMLWGYFDSIPPELEEAAMIDGCTRTGALFRVILPLSAPGVVAVTIFTFQLAWQEYLYALVMMSRQDMQLLPVGAARIMSSERLVWGEGMAFSVLMTVPVIVLYLCVQRYLVQGLTAGAVKG